MLCGPGDRALKVFSANKSMCYCDIFLWVWMYSVYDSTQFIIVLISSFHLFRCIINDYTFQVYQTEKKYWNETWHYHSSEL
jgi:hypothetical protein